MGSTELRLDKLAVFGICGVFARQDVPVSGKVSKQ
jgi:hypothetical protein